MKKKKLIIICIVVLLIILFAVISYSLFFVQKEMTPLDCAKLETKQLRDDCCAGINKDTIHIMCVGQWEYQQEKQECFWVCKSGLI